MAFHDDFSDLPDDEPVASTPGPATSARADAPRKLWFDQCWKCSGSGSYGRVTALGHSLCTACKGTGRIGYTTSPEQRAKARNWAAERRAEKQQAAVREREQVLAAFEAEHPRVAVWWTNSTFDYANQMRAAVQQFGHLTEKQLAAVYRCVEKQEQWDRERAAKAQPAAREVSVQPLVDALERGHNAGLKHPTLRAEGMKFSRAPDTGRNPGAIYVKNDDLYLGKIVSGKFTKSFDCTAEKADEIVRVCADPITAAIAFGKKFGLCSVCGRDLSDPESVERGIGPICYGKLFE